MSCPASCADIELTANPTTDCVPSIRRRTFSRFIFFSCGLDLPNPMVGNIKPLFDNGSIVASSTLVFPNGLPDPSFEDVVYDECSPVVPEVSGRLIDFEDRLAIDSNSGSPAIRDEWFNYTFWKNKWDNRFAVSYGIVYCNGDVYIPKIEKDGGFIPYTAILNAFISYQKPQIQGGGWIEFIKGTLNFSNDPLALTNDPRPDFNLTTEGIVI